MTFEGQYLTYAEYQALGGSAIGETPFNLLEFEARRIIDNETFNRLKGGDNIPQEVKLCEYKMINSILGYNNTLKETAVNSGVKSENTDGYSVTYISSGEIQDIINSKNYEYTDIVRTYLLGVIYNGEHLLYIGV